MGSTWARLACLGLALVALAASAHGGAVLRARGGAAAAGSTRRISELPRGPRASAWGCGDECASAHAAAGTASRRAPRLAALAGARRGRVAPERQRVGRCVMMAESATSAAVQRVHGREEYDAALESNQDGLVIVKYYASWCRACKALGPKVEKIARNHPGSKWYEVEFEANKAMCKELGIKVLPWIQFVLDGEVVESFSCGPSKVSKIVEKLKRYAEGECTLPEDGDASMDPLDLAKGAKKPPPAEGSVVG